MNSPAIASGRTASYTRKGVSLSTDLEDQLHRESSLRRVSVSGIVEAALIELFKLDPSAIDDVLERHGVRRRRQ